MHSDWDNDDEYGADVDDEWRGDDWGTDDDEPVDTIPCGNCGADAYEEAEQCPRCGEWLTRGTSSLGQRPLWWQVIGVLGIIAVILALLQ